MTLTRRRFLSGTGAVLATTVLPAAALDMLHIEGPAFGARWRVRVAEGADANAIIWAITAVVGDVDAAMSPFRATSEISAFNRTETTDWLPLSPATIATVSEAQRIAAQTQGAFAPTLGGLVGRFGFGPITAAPEGDFRDLTLGPDRARKAHSRQTLDLCGIAKGYALDQCAEALRTAGVGSFFIELGGEVYATGLKPNGQPWRSSIENPVPGSTAPQRVVVLNNEALATSGDFVNSYAFFGRRYSHIIDPRRMMPTRSTLASVSVFAPSAITADAQATALFAMGSERGQEFAQQTRIDALFISRHGSGLREVTTGDFTNRIIQG